MHPNENKILFKNKAELLKFIKTKEQYKPCGTTLWDQLAWRVGDIMYSYEGKELCLECRYCGNGFSLNDKECKTCGGYCEV